MESEKVDLTEVETKLLFTRGWGGYWKGEEGEIWLRKCNYRQEKVEYFRKAILYGKLTIANDNILYLVKCKENTKKMVTV